MPYLLGVALGLLLLLQGAGGKAGIGGKAGFGGGVTAGCTAGPTANLIARWDSTTTSVGTVTTWTDSQSSIVATAAGTGSITSVANIFGTVQGVRLTASNSQYFSLSSAVNGGANINHITIMVVWKPATVGAAQFFTGDTANSQGAFSYWMGNSGNVQGANKQFLLEYGQGTSTFTANTIYQMNVTYDFDTSTLAFRKNKVADTLSGSPTFNIVAHGINALGQDGHAGGFIDAWIGAIYIFAPDLNTTDTQTWENYFSCAYPGA